MLTATIVFYFHILPARTPAIEIDLVHEHGLLWAMKSVGPVKICQDLSRSVKVDIQWEPLVIQAARHLVW